MQANFHWKQIIGEIAPAMTYDAAMQMILCAYIEQKLYECEQKEAQFAWQAGMSYADYESEKYEEWDSEDLEKVQWFNQWTDVYAQVLKYRELKKQCETQP